MNDAFRRAAHRISGWVGSPIAFLTAFAVVLVWAVSGPAFGFSDTWQLVINTSTTIVTFLMVFLIQNTQNRDSRALHLKLDDLILYTKGAENDLVDIENLSEEQLARAERRFQELAKLLDRHGIAHEDDTAQRPRRAPATSRKRPARARAPGGTKGSA